MKKKELKKVEQIDQSELDEYNKIIKNIRNFEKKVVERTNYIVLKIFEILDRKDLNWHFSGEPEDIFDDIDNGWISNNVLSSDDNIDEIVLDSLPVRHDEAYFYVGDELFDWTYDFDSDLPKFPKRWLFEPFEQELKEGRKKYIKEFEQQKLDRKEKEKNDKKLKRQALKKLSAEEKKSLGIMENK